MAVTPDLVRGWSVSPWPLGWREGSLESILSLPDTHRLPWQVWKTQGCRVLEGKVGLEEGRERETFRKEGEAGWPGWDRCKVPLASWGASSDCQLIRKNGIPSLLLRAVKGHRDGLWEVSLAVYPQYTFTFLSLMHSLQGAPRQPPSKAGFHQDGRKRKPR